MTLTRCVTLLALAASAITFAQTAPPAAPDLASLSHQQDIAPNSPAAQRAHYVVLVSLDGFRYDYPTQHGAPNLLALGHRGLSTPQGMLPSYPSLTFPNHLTLVTGLTPGDHGIVANSFFDPALNATYAYTKNSDDARFYNGVPLWSLAQQQGMRAATFFWPGNEAQIAGQRPAYWLHFYDSYPDEKRIDQVIAWLQLPPAQRPHFITLYYSNVDHAGHTHGPDSAETREAVHHVDALMGELYRRLAALHLPVDLIVTADHGMIDTDPHWITLDELPGMASLLKDVQHVGPLLYPKTAAESQAIYDALRAHPDPRFTAYRLHNLPANFHASANPRFGDPVLVPNGPYNFRFSAKEVTRAPVTGGHGYDPATMSQMKAIFFAAGPDIRPGTHLQSFPNTDVYDFVAKILHLNPAPNDGNLEPFHHTLKK